MTDTLNVRCKFDGTMAYTGYDAATHRIILAFRGTSDLQNWVENIDTSKTDYITCGCPDCAVHDGFLRAYTSMKQRLLNNV